MCGIVGLIYKNTNWIKDNFVISKMLEIQKHRGPDDSGIRAFSLNAGISEELPINRIENTTLNYEGVFGFNRLSILDLSSAGHQPMLNSDENVILIFNGEIYNAFDFKNELIADGFNFKSNTDSEVILNLYLKYGFEKMITLLNGMFALAIADLRKEVIYVARDRFGIKPLYFINLKNLFAFSSELKSFKYITEFEFDLDENQIDEYLLFRNNVSGTLIKEIELVKPGTYLTYNHIVGIKKLSYFNINSFERTAPNEFNEEYYIEKLQSNLNTAVSRQLISDVKVGCQLSGGVDSSLIAYFANKNSSFKHFESVSVIFNENLYSEEQYIKQVTESLELNSHNWVLDPKYFLNNIEKATWHFESPLNHPNSIGIYLLAQKAREHVTVLLSGEGADEIYGGYGRIFNTVYPYRRANVLKHIKGNIRDPLSLISFFNKDRAILATSFMQPSIAKLLWNDFNYNRSVRNRKNIFQELTGSTITKQLKYEILSFLPDLLVRQDKMSMAHSIENRVPFLDNDLVANSFEIPEMYFLMNRTKEGKNIEKYLLKKIASKIFGNNFGFRTKMGFGIPFFSFFNEKEFGNYLKDKILPGIKSRGIFNYKLIEHWVNNISTVNFRCLEALWIIIAFEIWADIFLKELE